MSGSPRLTMRYGEGFPCEERTMGLFKKSCYTNCEAAAPVPYQFPSVNITIRREEVCGDINPNPANWTLLELKQFPHTYVIKVQYHNCTNFEGVKVMVYRGEYAHRSYLDPHFQESGGPIARFEPSTLGWELALTFAEQLSNRIADAKGVGGFPL